MCYDIKANLKALLKKAKYFNDDPGLISIIEEKLKVLDVTNYEHVSGFQHPQLPIVTNDEERVHLATWGLIPFWTKDLQSGLKFYNNTLNARSESIFEKPSFRDAARNKRCLVFVDGFYEHHHHNGKAYPFFIRQKNGEPFILAGLWSHWRSKDGTSEVESFTITTTRGNPLLSRIHNNPKMEGPRMPVILPEELTQEWLTAEVQSESDKEALLKSCCQPYDDSLMEAWSVGQLRGKNRTGNVPEASEERIYDDLENYRDIVAA